MENKPPYYEWMKEYIEAFRTLSSTRQYGMGPNPIALTEMLAYLKIWEVEDTHTFILYIMRMDDAYLDAKAKKMEREKGRKEAESKAKAKAKKG